MRNSRLLNSLHASRWIWLAFFFSYPAWATDQALADCARIAENALRLACYDRLVERTVDMPMQSEVAPIPRPVAIAVAKELENESFSLDKHWELDEAHKRGTFAFRPHNPNYILLASYRRDPNAVPYQSFIQSNPDKVGLSHTELSFQLGFKLKLLENLIHRSDLWVGYTQRSFWQAYNGRASSPFRDTNYQPELMFVTPINVDFLGMHARFVNVGLVHQSNGQAGSLSRSWNRTYVQAGLEKGDFNLLARAWYRIRERVHTDDNPDIIDYMGHGDVVASYRWRGNDFSALLRRNFSTNKGAVQLAWSFPMTEKLKGYLRFFSGYGETLIDYNSYQQSVGLGFLIDF